MPYDNTKVKLGGLWKNTTKNGGTYLAGSFCQAKLLIFPVKEKRNDKGPDYEMFLVPAKPKGDKPAPRNDDQGDDF